MNKNAVFVTNRSSVAGNPGGPALCTAEFIETLTRCGFELQLFTYDFDRSLYAKIARRLSPRPYRYLVPTGTDLRLIDGARKHDAGWIFLNFRDSITLAPALRKQLQNVRIVHLSHGADSTDYLHELRAKTGEPFISIGLGQELTLGRQLIEECKQRLAIDGVVCLSKTDMEIERWLGASKVTWLPRTISNRAIDWQPIKARVGYLGSLSHPPNWEGLNLILQEIERRSLNLDVRVIGGPLKRGALLATTYSTVSYLGPIPDSEIEEEIRTWTCLMHPIFCFARGASTKLATAIGWRIPIVTTTAGIRGYEWQSGQLPIGDSPEAFIDHVRSITDIEKQRDQVRAQSSEIAGSSPTLAQVANNLGKFLAEVEVDKTC